MKIGTRWYARLECFRSFAALLGISIILASCVTSELKPSQAKKLVGSGDVKVFPGVKASFERYKTFTGGAYFAISDDGIHSGWSICYEGPDMCRHEKPAQETAIRFCELKAKRACKLFARGEEVIWQGKVTYWTSSKDDQLRIVRFGMNPALRDLPLKKVCSIAVDYTSKPYDWSNEVRAVDFIAEAKGRNVSIYQCAFETGHQ